VNYVQDYSTKRLNLLSQMGDFFNILLEECEGIIQNNALIMGGPHLVIDNDTYGMLMGLCMKNRGVSYPNITEVKR
jgi:hypothetical protein